MAGEYPEGWRRRRSHLSLMADILEIAKEDVSKTRIMYGAGLGFTQLNDYMAFLLDRNLLEASKASRNTVYKTTPKGLRYLQFYRKTMDLLTEGKSNGPRDINSLHLTRCGSRVIVTSYR